MSQLVQLSAKEKKAWEQWLEQCKTIRDAHEPPKQESEKDKTARIKRLLKPENFYEYCQYYFPDFASAPFGWFHREAIDDILIKKEPLNIWEWSRESAKSVLADVLLASYLLVTGWLNGLILSSGTELKAKKLIGDLQAQLENNRRLIHDFGDFGITGSWIQGYFQTRQGIGFWAFGLGQNPAGVRNGHRRPNLGIVDDADSAKVAKNQELNQERVDWITGEFMGCLSTEESIFIYANNRVHKSGITAHMVGDVEEGDPKREGYKHIKVYFTEDPITHERLLLEEGGVPAWRERFTIKMAKAKIVAMGYRSAMRQLYHMHIVDGKRFNDQNMPWVEIESLSKYEALVSYCDPAFGESGKACYRAIILLGKRGLYYDVIWAWLRQQGSFVKAQRALVKMLDSMTERIPLGEAAGFRHKINVVHWTEANELQKILLKKLYQEENELEDTPWWPRFDMDKKPDKIGRIENLEPLADNGHLRFNAAMRGDKDMITLRDQFKSFPDGFVDGPDAVAGAISKVYKKAKSSKTTMRTGAYKRSISRVRKT